MVVEGSAQIRFVEGLNGLVGVGLTVTRTVNMGAVQVGAPAFATVSVRVLVPTEFQETLCGPCPTGLPPAHPSQFQVKTGPGSETPVQVSRVEALVVDKL